MAAGLPSLLLLAALLPVLLRLHGGAEAAPEEEVLVGWLGETYSTEDASSQPKEDEHGSEAGMVVLSWAPRVFLFKRFLDEAECDHLIERARPRLLKSGVVDAITGKASSKRDLGAASMHAGPCAI
jgi:prolyl 4-hydroxylase